MNTPAKEASSWSLVDEALEPLPNNNPQILMTAIGAVPTEVQGVVVASDNIWMKKDSIFSAATFSFFVKTVGSERLETRTFYKKTEGILIGEDGQAHEWDPDRFYGAPGWTNGAYPTLRLA